MSKTIANYTRALQGTDTSVDNFIYCDGGFNYSSHLQGFCTDGTYIYWSITNKIIKTDLEGTKITETNLLCTFGDHAGDPAVYNGCLVNTKQVPLILQL